MPSAPCAERGTGVALEETVARLAKGSVGGLDQQVQALSRRSLRERERERERREGEEERESLVLEGMEYKDCASSLHSHLRLPFSRRPLEERASFERAWSTGREGLHGVLEERATGREGLL